MPALEQNQPAPEPKAPSKEEFAYWLLANARSVEEFEAAGDEIRQMGLDPDALLDFEPPTKSTDEYRKELAEFIRRWRDKEPK